MARGCYVGAQTLERTDRPESERIPWTYALTVSHTSGVQGDVRCADASRTSVHDIALPDHGRRETTSPAKRSSVSMAS